jgi:Dimerisation domain/O-methyltransferase domain
MNDHTSELPPSVQMVQLLAGFQVSQALYAATKLGVPDQLAAGPRTVQELAEMSGAQPSSLGRLLRTLAGLGVLVSSGSESYRLTPLGETLVEGVPGSMRDLALMWMETHYQPFSGLADTLRTGKPAAEAYYGEPFFEWLEGQPEQVHRFSAAMANLTDGIKLGALQSHDFGTPRSIVDVGGADGTVLAHLLRRLPDATGLVYDLPHVVKDAEVKAKAARVPPGGGTSRTCPSSSTSPCWACSPVASVRRRSSPGSSRARAWR